MAVSPISKSQCLINFQHYTNTGMYFWDVFNLFKKNTTVANQVAQVLSKQHTSDDDLLKLARAIDKLEDDNLQHDLLCFLHSTVNVGSKPFVAKRQNITQVNTILTVLVNKTYRPWWTFFLIELPFYSDAFRSNVKFFITNISDLFKTRRKITTQSLINLPPYDEKTSEINYRMTGAQDATQQSELERIFKISLEQTQDHARRELIQEIKKMVLTEVPFGGVVLTVTGLSQIIVSYLSKEENKNKSREEQAKEIIHTISKALLKINAKQVVTSVVPIIPDIAEAAVSIMTSESSRNPLDTDRKIGTAFAGLVGGAVGGTIGTIIPIGGTAFGACVGTVVCKTAVARGYQLVEAWQTAPHSPESIIPHYSSSLLSYAFADNDAKNVLSPAYELYKKTEEGLNRLRTKTETWLSVTKEVLQNFSESFSEEHLEIINEEMNRLRRALSNLTENHSRTLESLSNEKIDNPSRVNDYMEKLQTSLTTLREPIDDMIREYSLLAKPTTSFESYSMMLNQLPANVTPPVVMIIDNQTNPKDFSKPLLDKGLVSAEQYLGYSLQKY